MTQFRPVARPGKPLGWGVEKWSGRRWVPVAGTACHYEAGAKQRAQALTERYAEAEQKRLAQRTLPTEEPR